MTLILREIFFQSFILEEAPEQLGRHILHQDF